MAALTFRRVLICPKSFRLHKKSFIHNLKTDVDIAVHDPKLAVMKLNPATLYKSFEDIGLTYYCGVPDSLLKDFCAYVTVNSPEKDHVITANEGNAVGLATGYHLATGKSAVVYLQNSGLGNMVNPLMSLAAPKVYSIPMLLLIGWRGEPGVKDEPQHITQGLITQNMLESMRIPYEELPADESHLPNVLHEVNKHLIDKKSPYCLLVRSKTFQSYKLKTENSFQINKEFALQQVIELLDKRDIIVSTTGKLSRELFEYREQHQQTHEREFLTVGSMGHASSIALGIAKQKSDRQVICLDGDGAALMHMGAMATVGQSSCSNLKHILFNNGAHDSVGGQPTIGGNIQSFSFTNIALACGYKRAIVIEKESDLLYGIKETLNHPGPMFLEVRTALGSRSNLGRPTRTPEENKTDFMKFISQS